MEIDILLTFICMKMSLAKEGKSFQELLRPVRYVVTSYMIVDSKSAKMTDFFRLLPQILHALKVPIFYLLVY